MCEDQKELFRNLINIKQELQSIVGFSNIDHKAHVPIEHLSGPRDTSLC
jgi:hypothetical protein